MGRESRRGDVYGCNDLYVRPGPALHVEAAWRK